MEGRLQDGIVRVDGGARQQFYDSRGYGRPHEAGDGLDLAPVEAAHLLARGDLDAVVSDEGRLGFREFLTVTGAALGFVVYRDLRDRGFYLSPAREGWVDDPNQDDFVVYPRGSGPWDDRIEHRVRVVGERESIRAADLGGVVLAVVDEDGELTYFDTTREDASGQSDSNRARYEPAGRIDASLLSDRVLVWDPPADLYREGFYGQRLYGRHAEEGPLQVSLVEAAYLARFDAVDLDPDRVVDRGRAVEGERFDRRLRAYAALRDAGAVPKSGFKFGADFRVYDAFTTVDDMGHSDRLVRVIEPDHAFFPRDLSLDVRLAGGVRKRMVFALTDATNGTDWLSVARLTP